MDLANVVYFLMPPCKELGIELSIDYKTDSVTLKGDGKESRITRKEIMGGNAALVEAAKRAISQVRGK